ncbi:histidine phosphatase family protein [Pseudalkalibacillus berkeleyi]|uniref:Histidine phosphatase family protein n=1 Tax=Pseudalkalibacillus berkeleyi TaxID=1069813 RepID=A0ABS9H1D4_9BACL|nr:histidine phosphatase family protein [Pseudalkalibacillus berkeleyi]MCF6137760.1 histidine phosphatase family protein [Pseudalkalibacillus berkeleyi]
MVTLYITRHGETVWNTEKRMQGWLDSDLTEIRKRNALSLGKRLDEVELTAIYTSPSNRTKRTTELIQGVRDIPVYYDESLKEINMGEWEGKTLSSIKEMYPLELDAFWNTPHLYSPVGGETFEQTRKRAIKFLEYIKKKYKSGNILVVTHSVVIKCLFSIFKNTSIENLWDPPNIHDTSLTIVELNQDKYRIVLEGDLSHRETTNVNV